MVCLRRNGLKLGVLIVGSLAWDDGVGGARKAWRQDRLVSEQAVKVKTPIRYGRKSVDGREGTYKMTFSMKAPCGSALVLPFRNAVHNFEELHSEARAMWQLEVGDGAHGIAASWGCMALLPRDKSNCPDQILEGWANLAKKQSEEFVIEHAHDEVQVVSADGLLQIEWPRTLDGQPLMDIDALLTVAAQPTLTAQNDYADSEDIAKAWLRNPEQDHYFYKNREIGIVTFQDDEIMEEFWRASTGSCGGIVIC